MSVDEYIQMIALKTSVLLAASLKIGALIGGATEGAADKLYQFGKALGIAFQLQDDYLDAFGDAAKLGKQAGGDILADKKTYLHLVAMHNLAEAGRTELESWQGRAGAEKGVGYPIPFPTRRGGYCLPGGCCASFRSCFCSIGRCGGFEQAKAALAGTCGSASGTAVIDKRRAYLLFITHSTLMNYWLVKSEPFKYSWDAFVKDGSTVWDGVRNYAARNNLRSMKKGDHVFFYHSNEGLEIVGIAKVVKEHYPDPTAKEGDWSVVEIAPVRQLKQAVTLADIKATPQLAEIQLIKLSRLSVAAITKAEYDFILKMGEGE